MNQTTLPTPSHHFKRLLQVDKIRHPRDFVGLSPAFWQAHSGRVCLEIGAGKGKHALQFATAHPDHQLIAIERTQAKFAAMARLALQADLPNLQVIHADAIAWSVFALPPNSLSKVFILYPNPEPHNPNQRWLNMPFFEFLLSRVQADGHIVLASNVAPYINEAEDKAVNVWQLPTTRQLVPTDSQRTHFEIKYLARGQTCWQLEMVKPTGYVTRFDEVV